MSHGSGAKEARKKSNKVPKIVLGKRAEILPGESRPEVELSGGTRTLAIGEESVKCVDDRRASHPGGSRALV
jgi:hypothetical protein